MPSPIKRLFVLMLENRSFDHIFGNIPLEGKTPDGNPTTANGLAYQQYGTGEGAEYVLATDPGHEFTDTLMQLCGPSSIPNTSYLANDTYNLPGTGPQGYPQPVAPDKRGFAQAYSAKGGKTTRSDGVSPVMTTCSPEDVSVLTALARGYAVCDNWYSSMPGPT